MKILLSVFDLRCQHLYFFLHFPHGLLLIFYCTLSFIVVINAVHLWNRLFSCLFFVLFCSVFCFIYFSCFLFRNKGQDLVDVSLDAIFSDDDSDVVEDDSDSDGYLSEVFEIYSLCYCKRFLCSLHYAYFALIL